ncbi:MAG: glycosyl hydrolase family 28-related protein [Armatimonadota bacterium]
MNKYFICSLCITIAAGFSCVSGYAEKTQVIDTLFPTDDIVIASKVINPPATADTDMTAPIQSAIDDVSNAGGGVVYLPAGRYLLKGSIIVRKGVTLRGDWTAPSNAGWEKGTILMPSSGRGDANATPAVRLASNTGIRNLAIWYPDQDTEKPTPYPWSISSAPHVEDLGPNMGANQNVINVTLVNSYNGIIIGPQFNFLHVIRNVYGTPLKTGISIDSCYDIGRTQNVDFKADWWANSNLPGAPTSAESKATLKSQLLENATAVDLGRDEWGYLYDVRVKGYAVGIKLRAGDGSMNGVLFGCSLLDCGTALRLEVVAIYGLGVTGCRFSGKDYAVFAPNTFTGTVQFNSCTFDSEGQNAVRSEGTGTMTFRNCDLKSWKDAAIDSQGGTLSVMTCNFAKRGKHIQLGEASKRAIILSNTFKGKPLIVNLSKESDLQVSHARIKSEKPDISLLPTAPDYIPATRKLFVVTDYGASPDVQDNTSAFRNALDAARKAGGGTVYVPAGTFRFAGNITVPSGVELRGSFDIAHHTICAGSALLPTEGRGNADGTPFISLETKSGIRGLTIWYPDQKVTDITAYPWAVRSLGPKCWVINLNCGNAYQGVDFWTHPSDGHVIKYLSGAYYRKGLFISKCKGEGWVDDLHYNPHFSAWVDPVLKPITIPDWTPFMDYVRSNLDAIVFGNCENEYVKGTFMYAAHDGIAFKDDNGGSNARVIHHGTDTGSRCAAVDASGPKGVEFINTQLTPMALDVKGAIVTGEKFTGKARFYNTMLWAEAPAGVISGKGDVLIQQLANMSGTLTLEGGKCTVENMVNNVDFNTFIKITGKCDSAQLIGNIAASGVFRFENAIGNRCYARANSLSTPPPPGGKGLPVYKTSWEKDDPKGLLTDAPAKPLLDMSDGTPDAVCAIVDTNAHSGTHSIRISGSTDNPKHSYAYFGLLNEPVAVHPDTVISYWIKPTNRMSTSSGIDLLFNDGSDLRSSGMKGSAGEGVHPANPKGVVGQWTKISLPIGKRFYGKTIVSVMFAYDGLPGTGPFETFFDDLSISANNWNIPWKVEAFPGSNLYKKSVSVKLKSDTANLIRYTVDGSQPMKKSPVYTKPIVFDKPGLWDLRYSAESADGQLSTIVFGQLYEIEDEK